jgi:hypothetical protein
VYVPILALAGVEGKMPCTSISKQPKLIVIAGTILSNFLAIQPALSLLVRFSLNRCMSCWQFESLSAERSSAINFAFWFS